MRKFLFLFIFFSVVHISHLKAQTMSPEKLQELISQVSDTLMVNGNSIQFLYQETPLICVYDANANRMRIITPIIETKELEEEQLLNMLVANFHSALDVKYALSDEIIWSVFIHPLKELSDHQVLDAIDQVYSAAATFGTTYSSTSLVFPGNTKKKESPKQKKLIKRG
ncbi:hypothetical protein [Maribacter sp. 2307UL18-2]|uniref:hypothetical protein n=1 Tax=Maribacter sp. 2307UL18-2 TaxID=3386274 RepID=UPI0039BCD5FC